MSGSSNSGPPQQDGQGQRQAIGSISSDKPKVSFTQDAESVDYLIESSYNTTDHNAWCIGLVNGEILTIKLVAKPPNIWLGQIKVYEKLVNQRVLCIPHHGYQQMTVRLHKFSPVNWKKFGSTQKYHNKVTNSFETPDEFYPGKIVGKKELGANQFQYTIQTGHCVQFGVPAGWCMIFMIPGQKERRAYTPILLANTTHHDLYEGQTITFVIKLHEHGKFTQKLHRLPLNQPGVLHLGSPGGYFDTSFLHDTDRLLLLAGGTGIAPFVGILNFIQHRRKSSRVKQVVLILCGRHEADLIWESVWKELAVKGMVEQIDGKAGVYTPSLTNSKLETDWFFYIPYVTSKMGDGPHSSKENSEKKTGGSSNSRHITAHWIKNALDKVPMPKNPFKPMSFRGVGCGPRGFPSTCKGIFRALEIKDKNFFTFDED